MQVLITERKMVDIRSNNWPHEMSKERQIFEIRTKRWPQELTNERQMAVIRKIAGLKN